MTSETNRVAIVTGASRGIGAAVAERLAGDGLTVVINYSGDTKSAETLARKIEAKGGRAMTAKADVSDPNAVRGMFDAAEAAFGGVEQAPHRHGIADVGPGGKRPAALGFDLAGERLGGFGVAGIIDDDDEALAGEALRDRRADAARGARYDCYLTGLIGHFQPPHELRGSSALDGRKLFPFLFRIIRHYPTT